MNRCYRERLITLQTGEQPRRQTEGLLALTTAVELRRQCPYANNESWFIITGSAVARHCCMADAKKQYEIGKFDLL